MNGADGVQGCYCWSLIIRCTAPINFSVSDQRLERLCYGPVFGYRDYIQMCENVEFFIGRAKVTCHNIIIIICYTKPVFFHHTGSCFQCFCRSLAKRLVSGSIPLLRINADQRFHIFQHLILHAVDIRVDFCSLHGFSPSKIFFFIPKYY